ncbi:MAG: hypothetical protein A2Y07_10900 [Planctomycetes bacterium GWF2_50_10]|nr:MAG: hypothetical protein A2Y07_10900 [Planctomycetes bacterium GWF2_50_10]
MDVLKRKRIIATILTIVALANLWAALVCIPQMHNAFAQGAFATCPVILIGASIGQWSGFLKEYIRFEVAKHKAE